MSNIETEQETDDRWIAEIVDVPGVMCYGDTREDAVRKVQVLYERVIADRLGSGTDTSPRTPT
jgi:predicted RNase H-like HicB family nuclease